MDGSVPWVRVTPARLAGQTRLCSSSYGAAGRGRMKRSASSEGMRWTVKPVCRGSMRRPSWAPKPLRGMMPVRLALAGAAVAAPHAPGTMLSLSKGAGDAPGARNRHGNQGEDQGGGKSDAENAPEAQPSENSRVPKSMATMVLDNSALSAALAIDPERAANPGVGARAEF